MAQDIDFAAIRTGFASNLASVTGMQIAPFDLSNPTPPCLMVARDSGEYDKAFDGGAHMLNFKVYAFVGLVSDIGAQKRLDLCLGTGTASSVKDALESEPTLGGSCADVQVIGFTGPKMYRDGSILGSELDVQVLV